MGRALWNRDGGLRYVVYLAATRSDCAKCASDHARLCAAFSLSHNTSRCVCFTRAVFGIPLACVALLWVGQKRGTLQNPRAGDDITPRAIAANVQRTREYFRNRVAYGSLYDQVCVCIVHQISITPALTPRAVLFAPPPPPFFPKPVRAAVLVVRVRLHDAQDDPHGRPRPLWRGNYAASSRRPHRLHRVVRTDCESQAVRRGRR